MIGTAEGGRSGRRYAATSGRGSPFHSLGACSMPVTSPEKQTRRILLVILLIQGPFVLWSLISDPEGFFKYLGIAGGSHGTATAWLFAAFIAVPTYGAAPAFLLYASTCSAGAR